MFTFGFRRIVVLAVLVVGAPAFAGETLESVEKKLIEAGQKVTSMQCKSHTISDYDTPNWKYKSEADGKYWFKKEGEKTLLRMESADESVTGQGGQQQKTKTKSTMVCDGEFLYVVTESAGQTTAMKQNITNQSWVVDESYFENLRKANDVKLLPDETVEGRSTYVIEAKPKPTGAPGGAATVSYMYFDKETGSMIKTVGKNDAGKVVFTSVTTDMKVNSAVSDDLFVFKAPEGVQVMDLTQMQQQSAEPATEAEEAEPAEEPEAAEEPEQAEQTEEPEKDRKSKLPKLPKPKWP